MSKTAEKKTAAATDDAPAEATPVAAGQQAQRTTDCLVDDGTEHMGRATPGSLVCSRHAMRYMADGRLRQ